MHHGSKPFVRVVSGILLGALLITACGGGGSGGGSSALPSAGAQNPATSKDAPTISGTPSASAMQDQPFEFQPAASDPNKDKLSFTIANKPSWATFSASTGRLHGTPKAEHVGTYANIEIAVTDGKSVTTLPSFTLNVVAANAGQHSATVSWDTPTENTDGTPLTNLAGFKIYYGMAPGKYSNTISVDSPGTNRYVVSNLPAGTFYFAVTAVGPGGIESDLSPEVVRKL